VHLQSIHPSPPSLPPLHLKPRKGTTVAECRCCRRRRWPLLLLLLLLLRVRLRGRGIKSPKRIPDRLLLMLLLLMVVVVLLLLRRRSKPPSSSKSRLLLLLISRRLGGRAGGRERGHAQTTADAHHSYNWPWTHSLLCLDKRIKIVEGRVLKGRGRRPPSRPPPPSV
jgi:hypothetical protein